MILSTEIRNFLASGGQPHISWLVWIEVINPDTNANEIVALHTDEGTITVTIDGQPRTYSGVGGVISIPNITFKKGLLVAENEMRFNILTDEINNLIRGYQPEGRPAQLHMAVLNSSTMQVIDTIPIISGTVGPMSITDEEDERYATVSIRDTVDKTIKGLTLTKSHQSQTMMYPNDEGLKYAHVAGTTVIDWGKDDSSRRVGGRM